MSKKSWVAMTGLGVLMATSAAQAHLIPICVEAYESGTEVSGAGGARAHVTFTQAGEESAKWVAWQKAHGKAAPYWSASSSPLGHCQQANDSSTHSQSQRPQVTGGVGPEASVRLAPVAGAAPELSSVESATELTELDSTDQTRQRHSSWALGAAGGGLALSAMNTFSPGFGPQAVTRRLAAEHLGGVPVNTFGPGPGSQAERPNSAAGTLSRVPVNASNPGLGLQAGAPTSVAGNNNGNIAPGPVGGTDGHPIVDTVGNNSPAAPATPVTQVPEPETLALLLVGLLGVAVTSRRRRKPATTG